MDIKKAVYYFERAAMDGDAMARNNLGWIEGKAGNHHRSMKHYMIAARAGHFKAMTAVKIAFTCGFYITKDDDIRYSKGPEIVTEEEYVSMLRAYHERQTERKSDARDKAEESGMFSNGQKSFNITDMVCCMLSWG